MSVEKETVVTKNVIRKNGVVIEECENRTERIVERMAREMVGKARVGYVDVLRESKVVRGLLSDAGRRMRQIQMANRGTDLELLTKNANEAIVEAMEALDKMSGMAMSMDMEESLGFVSSDKE
jgi:hypothetical protein